MHMTINSSGIKNWSIRVTYRYSLAIYRVLAFAAILLRFIIDWFCFTFRSKQYISTALDLAVMLKAFIDTLVTISIHSACLFPARHYLSLTLHLSINIDITHLIMIYRYVLNDNVSLVAKSKRYWSLAIAIIIYIIDTIYSLFIDNVSLVDFRCDIICIYRYMRNDSDSDMHIYIYTNISYRSRVTYRRKQYVFVEPWLSVSPFVEPTDAGGLLPIYLLLWPLATRGQRELITINYAKQATNLVHGRQPRQTVQALVIRSHFLARVALMWPQCVRVCVHLATLLSALHLSMCICICHLNSRCFGLWQEFSTSASSSSSSCWLFCHCITVIISMPGRRWVEGGEGGGGLGWVRARQTACTCRRIVAVAASDLLCLKTRPPSATRNPPPSPRCSRCLFRCFKHFVCTCLVPVV